MSQRPIVVAANFKALMITVRDVIICVIGVHFLEYGSFLIVEKGPCRPFVSCEFTQKVGRPDDPKVFFFIYKLVCKG